MKPTQPSPSSRIFLLLLAAGLLSSCGTAPKALDEQRGVVTGRWQELAAQPDRPVAVIGWEEAVRKMEAGNAKLRQAREAVRTGEEAVRQVPHNYIPELSLNLFAYPTLGTLGEGRLGDTFFYLGTLINLPNPVRYRAEALQARLQFMGAQVDCELLRRDLHVRLYRVFRKAGRLARQEDAQNALGRLAAGRPDSPAARQAQELADQNRAAWRTLEPDLAELLGDYSRHWRPQPAAGPPPLDYAAHPPALDGRNRFAALQITKAALQLVALDAQRQGLLVNEWPQVSVLLSAPPIYQRAAGRESYLSFEDLRVSAFITYSTDLRGIRALAHRQTARRSEFVRQELDATMQATVARLQDGVGLLTEFDARLARLRSAETALQNADAVVEAASLHEQADEVAAEVDELNLSFWVLDDPCWQHLP